MTPEKLFHDLLGLGLDWEVSQSRFDQASGTVFLEIREKPSLWESLQCPRDGGAAFCYDHTEVLTWRHLNIFQHRCEITCRLPRGKCRRCGHVFRVSPPWEGLSLHFTREFEAFVLLLLREMPVARVAELTGENDMRLWRMLFKHVEGAHAQVDWSHVVCVGVDEMNVRKGQEYITVFADLLAKQVLFATPGHGQETWEIFAQRLPEHNGHPHAIREVSMDMSAAYQRGVREHCRHAQVVFDKFHVIANTSKRVETVRRAEARLGRPEITTALRRTQWLWRKNPSNHHPGEQAQLSKIEHKNLATAKAYRMRLVLQDIYRSAHGSVARRRLRAWCRWVPWVARHHQPSWVLQPMVQMARTVQNHLEGIVAHWKSGLTNAYMEGLNSVFSAVKRKARGYRSTVYLIAVLYLVAGKLNLPHSPFH